MSETAYLTKLQELADGDVKGLINAQKNYGDSWKKRGGLGAFMMLARKWDRLEKQVAEHRYDVFVACWKDQRPEGILDDIKDLRRYLLLVEAEMLARAEPEDEQIPGEFVQASQKQVDLEEWLEQTANTHTPGANPDPIPRVVDYSSGADPVKQTKAVKRSGLDVREGIDHPAPFGYDGEV